MDGLPNRFRSRTRTDAPSFPSVQEMMNTLPGAQGNMPPAQSYSEAMAPHPRPYVRAPPMNQGAQGMVSTRPGYSGMMPPTSGYPARMPPPGFAGAMPSPQPIQLNFPDRMRANQSNQEPVPWNLRRPPMPTVSTPHVNPNQQNSPDKMRPSQSCQEPGSSTQRHPEMMSAASSATKSQFTYPQKFPKYNFEDVAVKVGRMEWLNTTVQHYLRGCKWSPDGECLLTSILGAGMHIVELPKDLNDMDSLMPSRKVTTLDAVVSIPESGMIYDYTWYPSMTSADPLSCFWAASGHKGPIHIWDAFTGVRRCSFRGYDKAEELEAAVSLAFSPDGQKLLGGYRHTVRLFDTNRPGKDSVEYQTKNTASCLACSVPSGIIAIGSWKGSIEIVSQTGGSLVHRSKLVGHKGGVTHMVFSADERRLYSGQRQDNELMCWDIRNPRQPLFSFTRHSLTNQKIFLDVSKDENWLVSGNTNGKVNVWNVSRENNSKTPIELSLHSDCCNGVSLHPELPILATSSGQFQVFDPVDHKIKRYENHLSMWWVGNQYDEN